MVGDIILPHNPNTRTEYIMTGTEMHAKKTKTVSCGLMYPVPLTRFE